jgi:hypothetical protein
MMKLAGWMALHKSVKYVRATVERGEILYKAPCGGTALQYCSYKLASCSIVALSWHNVSITRSILVTKCTNSAIVLIL